MTWNDPFRKAFANNIQISELRPQLEVVAFEVGILEVVMVHIRFI